MTTHLAGALRREQGGGEEASSVIEKLFEAVYTHTCIFYPFMLYVHFMFRYTKHVLVAHEIIWCCVYTHMHNFSHLCYMCILCFYTQTCACCTWIKIYIHRHHAHVLTHDHAYMKPHIRTSNAIRAVWGKSGGKTMCISKVHVCLSCFVQQVWPLQVTMICTLFSLLFAFHAALCVCVSCAHAHKHIYMYAIHSHTSTCCNTHTHTYKHGSFSVTMAHFMHCVLHAPHKRIYSCT